MRRTSFSNAKERWKNICCKVIYLTCIKNLLEQLNNSCPVNWFLSRRFQRYKYLKQLIYFISIHVVSETNFNSTTPDHKRFIQYFFTSQQIYRMMITTLHPKTDSAITILFLIFVLIFILLLHLYTCIPFKYSLFQQIFTCDKNIHAYYLKSMYIK